MALEVVALVQRKLDPSVARTKQPKGGSRKQIEHLERAETRRIRGQRPQPGRTPVAGRTRTKNSRTHASAAPQGLWGSLVPMWLYMEQSWEGSSRILGCEVAWSLQNLE